MIQSTQSPEHDVAAVARAVFAILRPPAAATPGPDAVSTPETAIQRAQVQPPPIQQAPLQQAPVRPAPIQLAPVPRAAVDRVAAATPAVPAAIPLPVPAPTAHHHSAVAPSEALAILDEIAFLDE